MKIFFSCDGCRSDDISTTRGKNFFFSRNNIIDDEEKKAKGEEVKWRGERKALPRVNRNNRHEGRWLAGSCRFGRRERKEDLFLPLCSLTDVLEREFVTFVPQVSHSSHARVLDYN